MILKLILLFRAISLSRTMMKTPTQEKPVPTEDTPKDLWFPMIFKVFGLSILFHFSHQHDREATVILKQVIDSAKPLFASLFHLLILEQSAHNCCSTKSMLLTPVCLLHFHVYILTWLMQSMKSRCLAELETTTLLPI